MSKILPEDMQAIRTVMGQSFVTYKGGPSEENRRDIALALILTDIYDRGYNQGYDDRKVGDF